VGVPRVWSALGPVPAEAVPPVCDVQSKSSVVSWLHPHRPDSNVHTTLEAAKRHRKPD
jgi:hypothetical protein